MGKIRVKTFGDEETEEQNKKKSEQKREQKKARVAAEETEQTESIELASQGQSNLQGEALEAQEEKLREIASDATETKSASGGKNKKEKFLKKAIEDQLITQQN